MLYLRWQGAFALAVALTAFSAPAAAAAAKSIAYFATSDANNVLYLIDWVSGKRARVVGGFGSQGGAIAKNGIQRVITLDAPLSATFVDVDSCGFVIDLRQDVNQVVVSDNPTGGTSQLTEIGTLTNIGGCQDGLVTPFGALTDPGSTMSRVDMAARPPLTDLVPGSQLAGLSEEPLVVPDFQVAQDLVTFQAGAVQFRASGNVVPALVDSNQWLILDLPGFQRGYARLAVNSKTAGETWIQAEWVGGQPVRVFEALMVKPVAGAAFGTEKQASRMWESGLFSATRTPFFIYLYQGGTGERISRNLDLGTESRTPITWGFNGLNIVQTRFTGANRRDRTWEPIRNQGAGVRWVIENELFTDGGGNVSVLIKPRVNFLLDGGKAVPPPPASQRSTGMVYLNHKPALAR